MARVIRALRRPGTNLVPAEVHDARATAAAIRSAAQAEAEQLRAQAVARGLAQGRAQAAALLLDAARVRERAVQAAEAGVVRASLAIAERLVRAALQAQPEQIVAIAAPLLQKLRRAPLIVLHVHPHDAQTLQAALAPLREQLELEGTLQLQASDELQRGDCVLVSSLGELDARIETQLAELASALRGELP